MIVGANAMTLSEWAKRLDPNGKVDKLVEILNQTNEILLDAKYIQGNLPTGHKTTVRTGLPAATWRMLNYGVKPSKSTTKQITDTCGMLETYSEIDKSLADLNGNSAEFLLSESKAFLESMNQEMASTFFYGDTSVAPAKFIGLAPRYNTLTREIADKEDSSDYVLNAGGTGAENTSIWLVVWGDNSVHGIFPRGSKAGISQDNRGQVTIHDGDGGLFEGYRTHFKWDNGLTVRDFRQVVRICNIDMKKLAQTDLVGLMIEASEKVHNLQDGKAVFYMRRETRTALRNIIRKTDNVNLTFETAEGKKVMNFDGIPVRICDAILKTEAKVV